MKKVGTILTFAGPSYIENLAEHQRQDAVKTLNTIHAAANAFNDEMAASSVDGNLTPQGRTAASAKTTASALAQLETIENTTIKKLTERATSLGTALRAKVAHAAPKDAAAEQQLREIRDQLRGLTASERLNVYRSSTDPLVLQAIETAPPTLNESRRRFEPFVDPEAVAEAVMARAEAADPVSATTLKQTRALADVYRLAVNGVRQEINDVVPGVPTPV